MALEESQLPPTELAGHHVREVLDALGTMDGVVDVESIVRARPAWPVWPQVALESLVGPPQRRLARLDLRCLHRFEALVSVLDQLTRAMGGPAGGPSGLSLLVERSQMLGHHGWGTWSAGTSCRMLAVADGWVAVNLPREDDLASVPALVERDPGGDAWSLLGAEIGSWRADDLVARAELLGLPIAKVADRWEVDAQRRARGVLEPGAPCIVTSSSAAPRPRLRVVDLTSLWAGPLAGWYLARAGADVVKVESRHRPDGARLGTPAFWRRLNAGKDLVELDLTSESGVARLHELVEGADVVLEASRPRALAALGLHPGDHVERGGIWCSITGYGRTGPWANRVAFGDDAAAAGGLVTFVDDEPWFIGDAAADPIAGVTAAAAVSSMALSGVAGIADVSMREAVAHLTRGLPVASSER